MDSDSCFSIPANAWWGIRAKDTTSPKYRERLLEETISDLLKEVSFNRKVDMNMRSKKENWSRMDLLAWLVQETRSCKGKAILKYLQGAHFKMASRVVHRYLRS